MHRTPLSVLAFLLVVLATIGCKRGGGDEAGDSTASAEETLERLQGSWRVDLEPTLSERSEISADDRETATRLFESLTFTIEGESARIDTVLMGVEQTQEVDIRVERSDDEGTSLCVDVEAEERSNCSAISWLSNGFRIETSDGLATYYVPAADSGDRPDGEQQDSREAGE